MGHVTQLCRSTAKSSYDWSFFKADHQEAYKQLPLDPSETNLAIIGLRNPADKQRYGFYSRTLVFGAVSAVLHYNVFSRILAEIFTRLFGIPLLSYFDDFGALIPTPLAEKALITFQNFCSYLGVVLKPAKAEVGRAVCFLGLEGTVPHKANGHKLEIRLTPAKARKWPELIASFLERGCIGFQELEKLIGRLSFSQTSVFGKFARTQLRPLYKKLYNRFFRPTLSGQERFTLRWWFRVLRELSPRIPCRGMSYPDFVLYTDAASTRAKICAVLFKGGPNEKKLNSSRMIEHPPFG